MTKTKVLVPKLKVAKARNLSEPLVNNMISKVQALIDAGVSQNKACQQVADMLIITFARAKALYQRRMHNNNKVSVR